MSTRTGIVLIGCATLLAALPFAWAAYAFEGSAGLLAFVAPLVAVFAVAAAVVAVSRRSKDS